MVLAWLWPLCGLEREMDNGTSNLSWLTGTMCKYEPWKGTRMHTQTSVTKKAVQTNFNHLLKKNKHFIHPFSHKWCFRKALFSPLDSSMYSVRRFRLVSGNLTSPYLMCVPARKWGVSFVFMLCIKGLVFKQCKSLEVKPKQTNLVHFTGDVRQDKERQTERERGIEMERIGSCSNLCASQLSAALNHLNEGWKKSSKEGQIKGRLSLGWFAENEIDTLVRQPGKIHQISDFL